MKIDFGYCFPELFGRDQSVGSAPFAAGDPVDKAADERLRMRLHQPHETVCKHHG